jgi:8-oxo-dGTP pyrophosphatase MutT (NUDIX family)
MVNVFKVIVSVFVRDETGRLLVIKRSEQEENFPGMYAIPGGTIEIKDSEELQLDVVESNLIREVLEETNVKIKVGRWLESTAMFKNGLGRLFLFFEGELDGDSPELMTSDETPEVFWANPEALDIEKCTPTLRKYLEQ